MAIWVEFLLLKFGRFQRDILLLRFFLVKYAFWGFVGLSEQGGGGFLVGVFKVKGVGGGPTCQSLFVFASLTLRGALQAQRKLRCAASKKVTKNAATLTAKLDHDGCIS